MAVEPPARHGVIHWYHPPKGKGSTGEVVSYLPGVRAELQLQAREMSVQAKINLLAHRDKGHASIKVGKYNRLDWAVYLTDPDPGGGGKAGKNTMDRSAMSIEFGWTQTHAFGRRLPVPIEHEGLHILGRIYDGMPNLGMVKGDGEGEDA